MQKKLFDVKELAAFMSKPEHFQYVNDSPNAAEREKRKVELRNKFLSGNFSNAANFAAAEFYAPPVNFSAAVEDVGSEFGIYDDCADFAEYSAKAKQETAIGKIKSLVLNHDVADSVKQYIVKQNYIRRRNRRRKAEQQKAFAERY